MASQTELPNLATVSAMLNADLPDINWMGFYLAVPEGDDLVVSPFQGRPACTRIPKGNGVVGACAVQTATLVAPDVIALAGHIACDAASPSEIVVPMLDSRGDVIGVWDVDSPHVNGL